MKMLFRARHWFWIAPLVLGAVFIGGGIYMITQGNDAKDEVRDALVRENVTVSDDADQYAGQLIDTPEEAKAEADVIWKHTVARTDGETYATLDRFIAADGESTTSNPDEALIDSGGNPVANPARETALTSANLRTSLNLAVMGFKVSDLVIGLGVFMIVMGATLILFLSPAVYWASEVANEREAGRREDSAAAAAKPQAP